MANLKTFAGFLVPVVGLTLFTFGEAVPVLPATTAGSGGSTLPLHGHSVNINIPHARHTTRQELAPAYTSLVNDTRDQAVQSSEAGKEKLCLGTSFYDDISLGLPLSTDCYQIAINIIDGGHWTFESGSHHQLVQYSTCAFGVESQDRPAGIMTRIGNQDIIDAILGSIHQFEWKTIVGASGLVGCPALWDLDPQGVRVKWGLYHT